MLDQMKKKKKSVLNLICGTSEAILERKGCEEKTIIEQTEVDCSWMAGCSGGHPESPASLQSVERLGVFREACIGSWAISIPRARVRLFAGSSPRLRRSWCQNGGGGGENLGGSCLKYSPPCTKPRVSLLQKSGDTHQLATCSLLLPCFIPIEVVCRKSTIWVVVKFFGPFLGTLNTYWL